MAKTAVAVRFSGDVAGLARSIATAEGGFSKLGAAAVGAGALMGAAAIGAGVALFKIGSDFDEQFDKIRVGTGATGDALEDLQGSFKNVLKGVPASFDDAGTAVADLNTRLGLTGKPLEDLSKQMINLSRITKTDLTANVDNLTRVFGDWEVATGDQEAALDKVYRASQASGIGLDDLSSSVVQFGAPLRNLGFGFEESLALLGQFNKTGVNTEAVFSGLKIGVGKLAKEGEPIPETFRRIVDEIKAMGPGAQATGKAIELFGQRAGPDLADAIAGGKFEIEGMLAAITGGSDTINQAAKDTESFGEKWTLFKNRVLVGLEPLATKVFDGVGAAMDALGPAVDRVAEWFRSLTPVFEGTRAAVSNFAATVQPIMERVGEVVGRVIDGVRSAFTGAEGSVSGSASKIAGILEQLRSTFALVFEAIGVAVDVFVAVATNLWDRFGSYLIDFTTRVLNNVMTVIGGVLDVIEGILNVFIGVFTGDWSRAWDGVKQIFAGVWAAIRGILSAAFNTIRLAFDAFRAAVSAAWSLLWNTIKTAAANAWSSIMSTVSSSVGSVLAQIRSLPARIGFLLGSLPGMLRRIGVDMILGMIGGIKSMARRLLNIAIGVVKDAFNAVKNFLGIGSPSKLFRDLGVNTGEGFVVGMDRMSAKVAKAGVSLADASVPSPRTLSLSASRAGASRVAGNAGGGGPQIIIQGGTFLGTNHTELKRELVALLNTAASQGTR